MTKKLVDNFAETLKNLPKSEGTIFISKEQGFRAYQEINNEMKVYRREFTKKEKESQVATSKIVLTS